MIYTKIKIVVRRFAKTIIKETVKNKKSFGKRRLNVDENGYNWTAINHAWYSEKHLNKKLSLVSEKGHRDMVEYLIKNGAEVDTRYEDDTTLLHRASMKGHVEVVKCLIQNGCRVNAMDAKKQTALHFAANFGHLGMVSGILGKYSSKI